MKNSKLFIAAVVIVTVIAGWLLHYFSDKEVIKRQFHALAQELSKEGEETPVMIALKMRPVKDFLAERCEVMVVERNYREVLEPGLAIRYLIMYRSRHATLLIRLDGLTIDIPTKGQARVSALVHLLAKQNQADFFEETHRLEFVLRKIDKKWRLHRATLPGALVQ